MVLCGGSPGYRGFFPIYLGNGGPIRQAGGMKSIPFPLRVAAGLAVTTAERVRELPKQVTGFPVTVASQVLQASMRVQQQVTELAIRGDDALSALRTAPEDPDWATFDEDLPGDLPDDLPGGLPTEPAGTGSPPADAAGPGRGAESNGHRPEPAAESVPPDSADVEDPWDAEELALQAEQGNRAPAGVSDYDELTLPQLRARLRRFSLAELGELLDYERANADRPSFTGMLQRRIGNVRKSAETAAPDADPTANTPTDDETGR